MNNDVFELIDMLYETITDAWAVPLGAEKCVIPRQTVLDLITEIKNQLPKEMEDAKKLLNARAEYIAAAKREADNIKKAAEDYARQAVAEHSITTAAKQMAAELVTKAETQAKELRKVTNDYADDTLKRTEEAINEALGEIRQSRTRFSTVAASMPEETIDLKLD